MPLRDGTAPAGLGSGTARGYECCARAARSAGVCGRYGRQYMLTCAPEKVRNTQDTAAQQQAQKEAMAAQQAQIDAVTAKQAQIDAASAKQAKENADLKKRISGLEKEFRELKKGLSEQVNKMTKES